MDVANRNVTETEMTRKNPVYTALLLRVSLDFFNGRKLTGKQLDNSRSSRRRLQKGTRLTYGQIQQIGAQEETQRKDGHLPRISQ